jgi:hypothetical protein
VNDRDKITHSRVEPSADQRAGAIECYRMFIALVDAEFTEDQALKIIGAMLGGQR